MTIRPATPEDAAVIADFQILMARETEGMELDPSTVRAGVGAVFADPSKGTYYVAEADGQVVASLLTVSEWSDWRCRTILWIHSVYVTPTHRRRGIFGALYGHLKERVQSDPALGGLRLFVERDNHTAQQTYTQMGMDGEHYRMFEWMK